MAVVEARPTVFSVIIPIYNRAQYLHKCLESVATQNYPLLEIILVNDGSTDDSGEICEQFAKQDARIHVYNTENQGVSAARNFGLQQATGHYISFIDSDDWLDDGLYRRIAQLLQHHYYDIVIFGLFDVDKIFYDFSHLEGAHRSQQAIGEQLPLLIKREIINSPVKIYNRAFLQQHALTFNPSFSLGEDFLFNLEAFTRAQTIYILPEFYYHCIISDPNSLSRKFNPHKYEQLIAVNREAFQIISSNYPALEPVLLSIRVKNVYSSLFDTFSQKCTLAEHEKEQFFYYILQQEKHIKYNIIQDIPYRFLSIMLKFKPQKLLYLITKLMAISFYL